jgi:small-conductance mechanosensitive channel
MVSGTTAPLGMAGFILLAGFLVSRAAVHLAPAVRLGCQLVTFAGFTYMLLASGVIPFKPTPAMAVTITYIVICCFKVIWWLAAAWLFSGFVATMLVFKRRPTETRFAQDICTGFIYIVALLGIIAYVFDMAVSGLLAASGVIAIVVGLALQSTLGDVFSGVALNLSKPYHPGDWLILEGGLEGRVIETNWRATQILTEANDLAIIPNSLIAKARLINASRPTGAHGLTILVRLDPSMAPARVIATLQTATLGSNKILRIPAPVVTVRTLDAVALVCEMEFYVPLIEQAPEAQNEMFDLVYRHCAAANIRLAPPAAGATALPPRDIRIDTANIPKRLLDHLAIFATLSDEEREALAPKMKRRAYKTGDVLVEQGVVAQSLFILGFGVLAALQRHDGRDIEVLRLAPGDCFGQASVMAGVETAFKVTALTRVVAYEIAREDLAPILKTRPAMAAELSQIMISREETGKERLGALDVDEDPHEPFTVQISNRIKDLLGLT